MKSWPALISVCIGGGILMTGCDQPELGASGRNSDSGTKSGSELLSQSINAVSSLVTELRESDQVTITNQAGKSIEGYILAKDESRILFKRASDLREFAISISSLSHDDQLNLMKLPDHGEELVASKAEILAPPEAPKPEKKKPTRFRWYDTIEGARVASVSSGKPLMLVFVDTTDRGLQSMGGSFNRTVLNDRRFRDFALEHFEPVQVNAAGGYYELPEGLVETSPGFSVNGVMEFPCTLIVSSDGRLKGNFQGYAKQGVSDYVAQLEGALKNW